MTTLRVRWFWLKVFSPSYLRQNPDNPKKSENASMFDVFRLSRSGSFRIYSFDSFYLDINQKLLAQELIEKGIHHVSHINFLIVWTLQKVLLPLTHDEIWTFFSRFIHSRLRPSNFQSKTQTFYSREFCEFITSVPWVGILVLRIIHKKLTKLNYLHLQTQLSD